MEKQNFLGLNLLSILKAKNITQTQLANDLGVAQNTVSSWVNNLREPSRNNILRISSYLNVDPSDLIGETSTEESKPLLQDPPPVKGLNQVIEKTLPPDFFNETDGITEPCTDIYKVLLFDECVSACGKRLSFKQRIMLLRYIELIQSEEYEKDKE